MMNTPTRLALLACSAGSITALTALTALLAVGLDSSYTTLLGLIILGGGLATVATIALTVALATWADQRAPWRTGTPWAVRNALPVASHELQAGQ